ncbi:UbiA family prenyltransferase, partial [Nostoc sp. NIES-2111]
MVPAMHMTMTVLQLRIRVMIAAAAPAGMAAAGWGDMSPLRAAALAMGVLGASGASGAFNHYYERDLDRHMKRTRARPFASGTLQPGAVWPLAFLGLLVASLLLSWAAAGSVATAFVFLGAFTYGVVNTVWLRRRGVWSIGSGGLWGSFAVLAGAYAVSPNPAPEPLILAVVLV